MAIRNYLTLNATFPDDAEWDERGNNLVPGGRSTGEYLIDVLATLGYTCSKLVQHSFYGWRFVARNQATSVVCLIQAGGIGPDTWLVIFKPEPSLLRRLFYPNDETAFVGFLADVERILANEAKSSNLRWYTMNEYLNLQSNRDRAT